MYYPDSTCADDRDTLFNRQAYCMTLDFDASSQVCASAHVAQRCLYHIYTRCSFDDYERLFGDASHLENLLDGFGNCRL